MKMKFCPTCDNGKGKDRPLVLFNRDPHAPDGRAYSCKSCTKARHRQWGRDQRGKKLFEGPFWMTANSRSANQPRIDRETCLLGHPCGGNRYVQVGSDGLVENHGR